MTNQDLLPNHYVWINVYNKFYKIGKVEPFQYDTGQETTAFFSSVASGSTSGFKNITEMEPDNRPQRMLFQVLMGFQYKMRYYVKVPTGTNRFGTDISKEIGFIDTALSPFQSPNKDFQLWLVDEYYPSIDARNDSVEALTPKIRFTGFKYELIDVDPNDVRKLQSGMTPYKYVIVGGVS